MAAKRKRVAAKAGDVVAIALADGSYGFGQIAEWERSALRLIVFTARSSVAGPVADLGQPLSSLDLTNGEVEDGDWPIVEHREMIFDAPPCPEGAGKSYSGGFAASLLELFHGIAVPVGSIEWSYEPMLLPHLDPKLLRPGLEKARAARGEHGAPIASPRERPPGETPPEPVPSGPAELRIAVRYDGEGMPSPEDLRLRHEIERRVKEFGEVSEAGAGEGVMDVWVQVGEGQRCVARLEGIVDDLGLRARTTITARSVEV